MTPVDTVKCLLVSFDRGLSYPGWRARRGAHIGTLQSVQGRSPVEGDRANDGGVHGPGASLL